MTGTKTRGRGELEGEIMRILWERGDAMSARDILDEFTGQEPAYTTVLTALDRLRKKGRVLRSGDSPRRVRFSAAKSEDEHASRSMLDALEDAADREAVLLRFAGNLSGDDVDLLSRAIARSRPDGQSG